MTRQALGPSARKALRWRPVEGRPSPSAPVRSSTWSPMRTPTRGDEPLDARRRRRAGCPRRTPSRPRPRPSRVASALTDLQQAEVDEVLVGLEHAARAERGEPPTGPSQPSPGRRGAGRPVPRRRSRPARRATSSRPRPSSEARVASSTLRKPWCSNPVAASRWRTAWCRPAVHLNGSSRSSAASMHRASCGELGNRSSVSAAGAELQRDLARCELVERREPAVRRARRGASAARRRR